MVEEGLIIEGQKDEFQQIMGHIAEGNNFLLSGGAGSGKTYSLVQVIRKVIEVNPTSKVACITYTNAAVKEIEERVNHKNLNVSTIHDFLWDNIKHFQKELKNSLISLSNDADVAKIKIENVENIAADYYDNRDEAIKIQYKEYLRLKDGIISHDELLILANYMFKTYPKLNDIVKDRYKYIFIDEYQDTHPEVVEILLEHFKQSEKKSIIGFFGDAMQAIYDNGIGDLEKYKGEDNDKVREVRKDQNRRNPQQVINLANKLRTDGLKQRASADSSAPNMIEGSVKEGKIMFLHSENKDISIVKMYLSDHYKWSFEDSKKTKELNLTHNLIADKAGFRNLMDIYDKDYILDYRKRIKDFIKKHSIDTDFSNNTFGEVVNSLQKGKAGKELTPVEPTAKMQKFIDNNPDLYDTALNYNYTDFLRIYVDSDQLIDDKKQDEDDETKKGSKRDNLIRHLFKIQTNISLYENKQYNEFLRVTDYGQIRSIKDKQILKEKIESLIHVGDKTIEDIIKESHNKGICIIDEKLEKFKEEKEYIYNRVKDVKYVEFQNLYNYLEGKTPFSTQHKTKGTEFDNVLVILDNGNWNKYNFQNLFLGSGTDSVLKRSQKIFYVCCTRAKENLAVFFHSPSQGVIAKAKEWFGDDNVYDIDR